VRLLFYSLSVVREQSRGAVVQEIGERARPQKVPRLVLLLDEAAAGEARHVRQRADLKRSA